MLPKLVFESGNFYINICVSVVQWMRMSETTAKRNADNTLEKPDDP